MGYQRICRVGVNLEGAHGQPDVRRGRGHPKGVMKSLPLQIWSVNNLQKFSTRDGSHGFIHGEFQFPGADFTEGIHAREPQAGRIFMTACE